MTTGSTSLTGLGILITRPAPRAATISRLIEKHGGEAIPFPVIAITPPADEGALRAALEEVQQGEVDLVIFVSAHAVRGVAECLQRIPAGVQVAAVGPKTEAQCARDNIEVDFVPRRRIDSEGLLEALAEIPLTGKRVLIFRGQSGRETIKQGLESRGATVRHVESYRRTAANPPLAPLLDRRSDRQIHMVLISSAAVLDALIDALGRHRGLLDAATLCAYSERVAEHCRQRGVGAEILVAEKPTDEAAVASMIAWAKGRAGPGV